MQNPKHEQLTLGEYQEQQAKKKKKLFDLPWPVKLIFIVPLAFFAILLLGYIFYVRQFATHG